MQKLILITQYMTSQSDQQIVIIHILPNILKSKGNQAIKFSQFIKFGVRNIYIFSKIMQKLCSKTSSRPRFVFSEKVLYIVKSRDRQLRFKIFGRPPLGRTVKNFMTFLTVDQEICLVFYFYKRVRA